MLIHLLYPLDNIDSEVLVHNYYAVQCSMSNRSTYCTVYLFFILPEREGREKGREREGEKEREKEGGFKVLGGRGREEKWAFCTRGIVYLCMSSHWKFAQ